MIILNHLNLSEVAFVLLGTKLNKKPKKGKALEEILFQFQPLVYRLRHRVEPQTTKTVLMKTSSSLPPLRIAYGRFMQEVNSFSPVPTTLADFTHFIEGEELEQACQPGQWEIKDLLRNMELTGFLKAVKRYQPRRKIDTFPLFSAFAIPGGPMLRDDFELICQRLQRQLRAVLPLDGVCFALHGALDVSGIDNAEAILLQSIREVIGQEAKIAITLDFHAVLNNDLISAADIICGYRTNPHRDFQRTGFKAGTLLLRTLLGEIKPTYAWRSLPMILGGGPTVDFLPPILGINMRMNRMENAMGALNCNIFVCHPFIKHPDIGWSTYVMTDNDQELAERLADELAERCWGVRHMIWNKNIDIDQAIAKAKRSFFARKLGTITISDASDVVGAGGTGENTELLKVLLEKTKGLLSYVPLRDAVIVEKLWAVDIETEVEVEVGGKIQPEINSALKVKGKLLIKKDTPHFGRVVVLDLGHVKLVLTEGSALALKPDFYNALGLNVWKPDITVVKSFFHFRIYYFFVSRKTYYVKTSGITDSDLVKTIVTRHPVYPTHNIKDWREVDALRRGISAQEQKVYFSWSSGKKAKNLKT